ncbi:MAG: response regulator transcription factor [Lachnospiraceae bacterium]|nr:response regulator transcription factor [Lachnospiraceae bacterium]
MYRIAICEDDSKAAIHLQKMCNEILRKKDITHKIEIFKSADTLSNFLQKDASAFHLLLLDIAMDGTSGMEFARQLRRRKNLVSIIFVTAYEDYLLDGYDVQPIQYLLKPVSHKKLSEAIHIDLQRNYTAKNILLKSGSKHLSLEYKQVIFIESMNHTLLIHSTDKTHPVYMSLTKAQNLFPASHFARCHKSYLVNMDWIADISRTSLSLKNGETLPVGRSHQLQLQKDFIRFLTHF